MSKLKWFHVIVGALVIALGYLQTAQVFPQEYAGYAMGIIGAIVMALQYLNSNVPSDGPVIGGPQPPAS